MNDKKLSRAAQFLLRSLIFDLKESCEYVANDFDVKTGPTDAMRSTVYMSLHVIDEICRFCEIEQDEHGYPVLRSDESAEGGEK